MKPNVVKTCPLAEADRIEGYLTAEESETLATLLQKLEQGLEGADPHN